MSADERQLAVPDPDDAPGLLPLLMLPNVSTDVQRLVLMLLDACELPDEAVFDPGPPDSGRWNGRW